MAVSYITPSSDFNYHPHQKVAIQWMLQRERPGAPMVRGGVLADEMGLGKTCMMIGLILNDPRLLVGTQVNTLLLVPPVLQPQWAEAIGKAGITCLTLQPHKKSVKAADAAAEAGTPDWMWKQVTGTRPHLTVFLSTYDRAANHIDALETLPFDRIVCDEGHIFKNGYATGRFRKLIRITAPQRWILSGTPIQNNVADFGNLLKFLGMSSDVRIATPLAVIAAEVLLRRTVGDVREAVPTMPTEPPLHTVHAISLTAGSEEERVYNALVGRYEHARETHAKSAIILELYLRICQFITHPAIYVASMVAKYGSSYPRTAWEGTASKFTAFGDFIATTPDAPTIVFTTFKQEMELIEDKLTTLGYRCWKIGGGMTDKARDEVCAESKAAVEGGLQKAAILVQIVAGGAGLNHQQFKRVVFPTTHWNPAVVDQAVARAYRMGQKERVEVHHFLMADDADLNMDRYKAAMHGGKRDLAIAVHPKLYCDSAISSVRVLGVLDSVGGVYVEGSSAVDAEAEAEDPVAI